MPFHPTQLSKGPISALELQLMKTSVIPTVRISPGVMRLLVNTTSACVVINTTATTWRYLYNTSVQK